MTKNVFLIEDHDAALKIWRQKDLKNLDLVHIDAHIDFGFYQAKPIDNIIREAKTLKELKSDLEYSLAYQQYENNLDKQTNIGNYIYPAMREGIVKNFYWVIPGGLKEFRESLKIIKNIIRNLTRQRHYSTDNGEKGIISTEILGRKFIVCALEKLPVLRQKALLDIDTDFLVINSIVNAQNTADIGKRKPWILPKDLTDKLKKQIKQPRIITIAYSVNGGYTPMGYKHLGDELAYNFAPVEFRSRFRAGLAAAENFNLFRSTGRKEYYEKAIVCNPTYRVSDNNYGPLYLALGKFSLAKKEFLKVLRVDPENPACLLGLGQISLRRNNFKKAKTYFSSVLNQGNQGLFNKLEEQYLLGMAAAEFKIGNIHQAKKLLLRYHLFERLNAQSHYLLGRIYEKERRLPKAVIFYKNSLILGFDALETIFRLLKIAFSLDKKHAIISLVTARYNAFKAAFLKKNKPKIDRVMKNRDKIEKKMRAIEKMLSKGGENNARKDCFA